MRIYFFLFTCLWALLLLPALATAQNMFAVVSGGYTDTRYQQNDEKGASYKVAMGYQIHPQWYIELGYQRLADGKATGQIPADQAALDAYQAAVQADGVFAALLGKASGQHGELYYRVGILKADVQGRHIEQGSQCTRGNATGFAVNSQTYQLCHYDDGVLAGVLGLGFDFVLAQQHMLRIEAEYIKGESEFKSSGVYLGYRFNF